MKRIIHKLSRRKLAKVFYFDLLVVSVVLVVISIFLYNRLTKKSLWIDARIVISNNDWWWTGEPPKYWLVDGLEGGMVSYNSFGENVAEITDVEIFSAGASSRQAFIDLKIKVSYDKKRQIYLYNFQPIQKGKSINLTFGSHNVNGLIIALGTEPEEKFIKKIKARVSLVEDWLAESYQVGQEMRDTKGRVLAKVEKVEVRDSKIEQFKLLNGGFYRNTEKFKDVYLEISLSTLKDKNGVHYFMNGAVVKLGEEIWFHFPELVAQAKIMEILE